MSFQARVLIVAREDNLAGPLAEGLDRLGWRTITARGPHAALAALADLTIEAVIIDLSCAGEDPAVLAKRLRAAVSPRLMPIVAIGEPTGALKTVFDLVLSPPLHAAQAVMRLESLVRMTIAEEEFESRRITFSERGRRIDGPDSIEGPYRILAVGEPAPKFLALSHALAKQDAEIVGSFTAYTAFDYLHEKAFDAVVLWAGQSETEALSIAAGMRRNTRLYHIPTMLYLAEDSPISVNQAFNKGITDVASPETPEEITAGRVVELARTHRRQKMIRGALEKARSSGLMDPTTGLFTRELFAAHLARMAAAARSRNRPLAVCVLRIADTPAAAEARKGGWLDRAAPQIGSMISRLVRVEDTAARLGPEVFALALPSTQGHEARAAAERITAVIGCTAFDAGPDVAPFVVNFDIGIATVEADENPAVTLERAAAKSMAAAG